MVLSYLIEAARYVLHLFSSSVVHVPGVRLVVPQRKLGVRGSALEMIKLCSFKVSAIIFTATLNLTNFLYGEEKTVWCLVLVLSEDSLEAGAGPELGGK